MKFRVHLTAKAESDVDGVLRWFAEQHAETAAKHWLAQLHTKIATLETFPHRCPLAAESRDLGIELREMLFGRRKGKYRILFTIDRGNVVVLHVRRGSRDVVSAQDLTP